MNVGRSFFFSAYAAIGAYAVIAVVFLIMPDLLFSGAWGAEPVMNGRFLGTHALLSIAFSSLSIVGAVVLMRRQLRPAVLVDRQGDALLQNLECGIATVGRHGLVKYVNDDFVRLLGSTGTSPLNQPIETLIAHHSLETALALELPEEGDVQRRIRIRIGGHIRNILLRIVRLGSGTHDGAGEEGWVVTLQDLGALESLTSANQIYLKAIDASADGIAIVDCTKPDRPMVYVNKAFEAISGYSASELLGRDCCFLQGADRNQPEVAEIRRATETGKPITTVLRNYTKTGQMFWNELRMMPINEHGIVTHYVALMRDVTELRHTKDELETTALRSSLTGIANQAGFTVECNKLLARCANQPVLYVRMNVERFHDINITFGYETGDALLKQIAERLRQTGMPAVARLGRDDFVLATAVSTNAEAIAIVDQLRIELDRVFIVPGASLRLFFRIGYVVGQASSGTRTLLQNASAALNDERYLQTHQPRAYDVAMDREISRRMRIVADLQVAVANMDFILYYQPKVSLRTGLVIGAEALIRWQHPTFGLQLPGQFISAAEHTGLIVPIGAWVLRTAMEYTVSINRGRADPLHISVNVSQKQFRHTDVPALVETLVDETGCDPAWITLELTESMFADDSESNVQMLWRLRDLGVGLSIDDFGTGYSSLRCLDAFPVTEIKIDRSFVAGLDQNHHKRAVIEAVTHLGNELGARVVAEGIEREVDRLMLLDLGCNDGQGYFFSMPLTAEDFSALVENSDVLPLRGKGGQASHRVEAVP